MKKKGKINWLLLICILVSIAAFSFSLFKIRDALLKSGQAMGAESASKYGAQEQLHIEQYEYLLNLLEYQLRPNHLTTEPEQFIRNFLHMSEETMGLWGIEIYGYIDGTIVAATPWEQDAFYDAVNTEWYQGALSKDGIYYTDVYQDARLKTEVVTLSKKIAGTDGVVAVDLYPKDLAEKEQDHLPSGSHYFLSDGEGNLMKWHVSVEMSKEEMQERYMKFFCDIKAGKHYSYDSHIVGVDGKKRGVYYVELENGWYAVVTIPFSQLLSALENSWENFLIVMLVFVGILVLMLILEYRTNKEARIYNEIVRVLGNSYYALYLIRLSDNQYFMLKGSDFVKEKIPKKGSYEDLLEVIREIIEEETYEEFKTAFSRDNLYELTKKRVRDFGGDFKRLFNKEYRWVHVQMLYDESLQQDTVVLGFKDIDDMKRQELSRLEFMKESMDSVDQMAKSKNIFFSNMSHDMRTPLNGIIGLTNLAMEHPEQAKGSLQKIKTLSNQLLFLINDILELSKMEQGKLTIQNQKFNIKTNLEDLISIHEAQVTRSNKTLHVQIEVEDEWVNSDWNRIRQILDNLLSNAFKFTEDDGEIWMQMTEQKDTNSKFGKYQIVVRDNGAGMSEEFLEKIFIPFERETKFGAAKVAGTGLGMPIVHDLVVKMQGTITVNSTLGEGSTFTIVLPLEIREGQNMNREERLPEPVEELDGAGRTVLLAEDNEINMEIATEILKMFGFEVDQAWNGKEALEKFQKSNEGAYAFIMMDMKMPVMDGCEAAKNIRRLNRPDAKTIPIIAATANAFTEDIALTQKAGMNAHISKPIDFEILKKTISRLLQ